MDLLLAFDGLERSGAEPDEPRRAPRHPSGDDRTKSRTANGFGAPPGSTRSLQDRENGLLSVLLAKSPRNAMPTPL